MPANRADAAALKKEGNDAMKRGAYKAAVEAFHNGFVAGNSGGFTSGAACYTCHKIMTNPVQITPCERCITPFCSAKCLAVHRMDARECDLRAKIRESGGIVGLGNAGKQTAGAGRDFSKLAASFLQDRMEMILLQASLIGEDVTDCVIVVNLDDEEIKMFTRALSQKAEELAAGLLTHLA